MSVETYSLVTNFAGGLNNSQLMDEINADVLIVPVCNNVRTDGDVVSIDFASALDGAEKTQLDSLIAGYVYVAPIDQLVEDRYTISDLGFICRKVEKLATVFTAATPLIIQSWADVSGTLEGWNGTTGTYTMPADGVYSFNLLIGLASTANTEVKIRAFDGAATVYSKVLKISDLASDYTGGAACASWICHYILDDEVRIEFEFAAGQTADVELSILQIYRTP